MGSKIGLAELKLTRDDGTPLTRIEAEKKLREETVYHRRLRAAKVGLPNKVAQHMLPISITHWLLDHWVQTGQITGEIIGIKAEFDADDNKEYVQQLAQRLSIFVEYGYAVTPNPGEGIDMSFVPPGFPPMPPQPNGQQAAPSFVPPPPPPMPGMPMPGGMPQQGAPQQMMQPPMPGQVPQQGFPQPGFPQQMAPQPPMPPMPPQPPQPQGYPQQMAPQGFPQQQPGFPQQMQQPQMQQQPQQQPQGQQGQVQTPTKADPSRQWGQAGKRENGEQRTRRTKEELAEDSVYEAWRNAGGDPNIGMGQALAQQPQQPQQQPQMQQPPQMPQQMAPTMMTAPPNPFGGNQVPMGQQPSQVAFGAPGLPQMPQMGAPQVPQQQPQQAPVQTAPAISYEDLLGEINRLQTDVGLLKHGIAHLIRIMHQKPGESDLYLVLTEVAGIRPQ